MLYRPLGITGLKVSELGFGCSRLGGTVEQQDDREVLATLQEALESGVNFFDTADSYGQGRAEELLGRVVGARRASVVIASKAGYQLSATGGLLAKLKPLVRPLVRRLKSAAKAASRVRAAQIQENFSPDYLRTAIEGSLRRLRSDYLDVFQLHNPPVPAVDGLGDVLERLQREGKLRHWGVACALVSDASYWLKYPGVSSLQIRLNLTEFEEALPILEQAGRKGIAIVARETLPLARMQASGEYEFLTRDGRRTAAQAALAFALQFPEVSVVIAGMRSRGHLRENLAALESPPLGESELDRIFKRGKTHAY